MTSSFPPSRRKDPSPARTQHDVQKSIDFDRCAVRPPVSPIGAHHRNRPPAPSERTQRSEDIGLLVQSVRAAKPPGRSPAPHERKLSTQHTWASWCTPSGRQNPQSRLKIAQAAPGGQVGGTFSCRTTGPSSNLLPIPAVIRTRGAVLEAGCEVAVGSSI